MKTLTGVAASNGTAIAPAWIHSAGNIALPNEPVSDPDAEVEGLDAAIDEVVGELEAKASSAGGELGEILEAQVEMARDPELAELARTAVREHKTPAAKAVMDAGESYAVVLEGSDSEYMAARADDVRDVCRRIARRLIGAPEPDIKELSEPVVIIAGEVPPADVADLDRNLVVAIATEQGSKTSHTAIVARALGIPAVVAVGGLLDAVDAGTTVAVDGVKGVVHIDPEETLRNEFEIAAKDVERRRSDLESRLAEGPTATSDGHRIEVAANVGSTAELRAALDAGAEAVGLLRTELLFLERRKPPGEDEQLEMILEMAELLDGKRMIVRTFDFGADKPIPFIDVEGGPNPALGVRGIRLAKHHPELLETQLRAIVGAAGRGARLGVMAPMVASTEEAEWFVQQVRDAGGDDVELEVGVMVEVPSAVLVASDLAAHLDFFSIGTNDLTQYLHAADRQQGALAALQDPFSPAVLRAVEAVSRDASDRAWVGVCGEAAGDPAWALVAIGLGVRELSMGAGSVLEARVTVGEHSLEDCRAVAKEAAAASSAADARTIAERLLTAKK
ncbi:MAG: phosphoenolpyruvate--protein phosphotransferase [Actinobacteria bacterium]|nr:phosphoenolpyruvate--protein phosphotransferase [Actinomycetota bacterium]